MTTKHKGHANNKRHNKPPQVPVDLIWGTHPVFELLCDSPGQIIEIWVTGKSAKLQEIINLATERHVTCHFTTSIPILSEQIKHQGVMARIKPVATIDLSELLTVARLQSRPPLIIALDSIQDPHNFGAIIRSAAAAGVTGIIYTKDRAAPLSGTVAKVSVGSVSRMNLCPVTNLVTTIQKIKKNNFWVFGTAGDAPQDIYQADFTGSVCLVIGGERKGIRPLVKQQCDFLVSIPMHGGMESLNASVAAALVMFEVIRQQRS